MTAKSMDSQLHTHIARERDSNLANQLLDVEKEMTFVYEGVIIKAGVFCHFAFFFSNHNPNVQEMNHTYVTWANCRWLSRVSR